MQFVIHPNKMNHFALKSKLYLAAIKAAFKELSILKNMNENENLNFA